ncbi:MAG: peroxide stress protein YaaA [Solobacterium sp.]|nr:peroxide stress protein YaaA [Solobacterium sp.]
MKLILSPAKTMRKEEDLAPWGRPQFLAETAELLDALKALSPKERKALWKCSDSIASLNEARLAGMNLEAGSSPALYSYSGLAYTHLSPESLSDKELSYLEEHLRILSGFYGILRPMDGIVSYRLEMAAPLQVKGAKNLYEFWGDRLAKTFGEETVIDLASEEYSSAVTPYLSKGQRIQVIFAQESNGKLTVKGTFAKMARGDLTRWMAEEGIEHPNELIRYDRGYHYDPSASDPEHYVFIKE